MKEFSNNEDQDKSVSSGSGGESLALLSLHSGGVAVLVYFITSPNGDRVGALLFFGGLGLLGVFLGHRALHQIKRNHFVGDKGTARAGLLLGYFIVLLSFFIGQSHPGMRWERGNITKGISNCRQIVTTLKLYASNHEGNYPDAAVPAAQSSNAVFRQMFVSGEADNEMIFGCPASQLGTPDGNIGAAPDFKEALQSKENHWAMTKGLKDSSDGKIPLVYENPLDATWPPKWNPDAVGRGTLGRAWSGGRVIVGLNDGSVSLMPLESAKGEHVGLKPLTDGKPVFPDLNPKPEVLQVETSDR